MNSDAVTRETIYEVEKLYRFNTIVDDLYGELVTKVIESEARLTSERDSSSSLSDRHGPQKGPRDDF